MIDKLNLLSDDEVITFVIRGYLIIEPDFPEGFNEAIYKELEQLGITRTNNPGNAILEVVPKLYQVYDHPKVHGALVSLLGQDFQMSAHRHCHMNQPGTRSQSWHQDSINQRHHQVRKVLTMYYPQDVTPDMGPTAIVPGTHFRNAPSDRMATYGNFREQVLTTVKAGTVAIVHYDIWHAATANSSHLARYMLKFLFDRVSEPKAPSWNHDPTEAATLAQRLNREKVCAVAQSDFYKEWGLRQEMWDHLMSNST